MWLWRMHPFWRIKLVLSASMLAAIIVVCGRSLAQIHQSVREDRRMERKVDALQKDHDALKLNIETRLVRIETYVSAGLWLLGGITLAVVGQLLAGVGKGLRILLEQWRAADTRTSGKP